MYIHYVLPEIRDPGFRSATHPDIAVGPVCSQSAPVCCSSDDRAHQRSYVEEEIELKKP